MSTGSLPSRGMILLVEDDRSLAAGARRRLEREGFRCRAVADVGAALHWFAAERPDLVLSDYHLPDGTADELLRAWSTEPTPPPILVCSAAPRQRLEQLSRHPLVTAVLAKPVSPDALLDAVTAHLPPNPRRRSHAVRPLVGAPERRALLGELPSG